MKVFPLVCLTVLLGIRVVHAQSTGNLAAEIEARSAEVAKLRSEFDGRLSAFARTPAFQHLVDLKSKFAVQLWRGDAHDPQRLVAETRQALAKTVEGNAEWQKLAELRNQLRDADESFKATAQRVQQHADDATRPNSLSDRLARLRASEKQLRDRITQLQGVVSAQKDPQVKAHNQALIERARSLADDMNRQIHDLEAEAATGDSRQIAGPGDAGARDDQVDKLRTQWQRALRRQDDVGDLFAGLTDIGTKVNLTWHGQVSVEKAGGKPCALEKGQDVMLLPGDSIQTGAQSAATMKMPDGAKVVLGANSRFTLDPSDRVPGGLLHHGMMHLLESINASPRRIRTPTAVCAVRGTDFVVHVKEGQMGCLVRSGAVEITPSNGAPPVLVRAGQRFVTSPGTDQSLHGIISVEEFETQADACAGGQP